MRFYGQVFTLLHEGITELGLKGSKVKTPQEKSCQFPPTNVMPILTLSMSEQGFNKKFNLS